MQLAGSPCATRVGAKPTPGAARALMRYLISAVSSAREEVLEPVARAAFRPGRFWTAPGLRAESTHRRQSRSRPWGCFQNGFGEAAAPVEFQVLVSSSCVIWLNPRTREASSSVAPHWTRAELRARLLWRHPAARLMGMLICFDRNTDPGCHEQHEERGSRPSASVKQLEILADHGGWHSTLVVFFDGRRLPRHVQWQPRGEPPHSRLPFHLR